MPTTPWSFNRRTHPIEIVRTATQAANGSYGWKAATSHSTPVGMRALKFDWEEVSHKTVSAVVGRSERRMNDGSLAWDALAFAVNNGAIVLTVTADTDEIVVAHEPRPGGGDWKPVTALADAVGKPLGWCWVGTNYRGYRDSFTVALGDVVPDALQPRLTFVAESAALTCFELKPRTA